MTDKELIQKIQTLKAIKPSQEWVDLCRQNLVSRLDGGKQQSEARIPFWRVFGILNASKLVPVQARVVLPALLVLVIVLTGFLFNVGSIVEEKLVSSIISPNNQAGNDNSTAKPIKKSPSLAQNISNGVKGIIDKVKTVTVGGNENSDELKAELQRKLEVLKEQTENLFLGSDENKALAEQAVLILKEADDFFQKGDLTSALERITAAERLIANQ